MTTAMKPCPFCGHEVDLDDGDTLYPTGTGWKVRDNGMTTYHPSREVPKEQWCYSMHCVSTSGGCDAEVHGDTAEEAIKKWNTRA